MVNECGYIVFLLLLVPYIESGTYETFWQHWGCKQCIVLPCPSVYSDDVSCGMWNIKQITRLVSGLLTIIRQFLNVLVSDGEQDLFWKSEWNAGYFYFLREWTVSFSGEVMRSQSILWMITKI